MSRGCNKYPTLYVRFPLVNYWFNIKEVARNIAEKYVSTFVLFQMFWFQKQRRKYIRHYMLYFSLLWVVTSPDSYSSMKDKLPSWYVSPYCYFTMEDIVAIQQYYHLNIMFFISLLFQHYHDERFQNFMLAYTDYDLFHPKTPPLLSFSGV